MVKIDAATFGRDDAEQLLRELSDQGYDAVVGDPNSDPPRPVGAYCRDLEIRTAATWCAIGMSGGRPSEPAIGMVLTFVEQVC